LSTARGQYDRLAELAVDLVRLKVDVILSAWSTPATVAAKKATSRIPIVFVGAIDPIRTGLVASLARPGGNVTGFTQLGEVAGKRLELLREAVPSLSHVVLLWNPANVASKVLVDETQVSARALGLKLSAVEARVPGDFEKAFTTIKRMRPDAFISTGDALHQLHLQQIIHFAIKSRLPTT
jgi:putative tryptophan/tyrosine transport system substrate-binding protein